METPPELREVDWEEFAAEVEKALGDEPYAPLDHERMLWRAERGMTLIEVKKEDLYDSR